MLPIAILAGGLATRMRPATESIPKALLPVRGRPFLDWQLELLRDSGVEKVILCTGYLGEQIQTHAGNGEKYGLEILYSHDGPALRGTGGAILGAIEFLSDAFFVLYGDSYLPIDYRAAAAAFEKSGKPGLMTVLHNSGRWDRSNVRFRENQIETYDKAGQESGLEWIDFGLSAFRASVFSTYAQTDPLDLGAVMRDLIASGSMAGHEVTQRFYEIGSPEGVRDLEKHFAERMQNQTAGF